MKSNFILRVYSQQNAHTEDIHCMDDKLVSCHFRMSNSTLFNCLRFTNCFFNGKREEFLTNDITCQSYVG